MYCLIKIVDTARGLEKQEVFLWHGNNYKQNTNTISTTMNISQENNKKLIKHKKIFY